ncbi:ERCC4 domain-containing protein [Sorangium sp. So ce1335]|uniref:ERCC4 domain-containing protein n=1 Tax=Sorangium sp. So ce1335 TaxID=3133335 RepID=UPI003F63EB46
MIAPLADLVVVVDTREQRPWRFPDDVATVRAALPAEDYSVQGLETRVAIERKELGDFVNACTHERARFIQELERLKAYDLKAIVVEASVLDVAAHAYRSRALPQSSLGSAVAFHIAYGVPVIWAGDRHEEAARIALAMLFRFARKARETEPMEAA